VDNDDVRQSPPRRFQSFGKQSHLILDKGSHIMHSEDLRAEEKEDAVNKIFEKETTIQATAISFTIGSLARSWRLDQCSEL
jgi:hypothetical protein